MKYVRPYKRWEKAVLWLFGTQAGLSILAIPVCAAVVYAFVLWRWHFVGYFFVSTFSFVFGWNLARRKALRDGYIDKI